MSAGSGPNFIAAGADGNLWFTDLGSSTAIGRINPATQHIDEFGTANGLNPVSHPQGITAGPDGNLWFADLDGAIGRIDLATQHIDEFSIGLNPGTEPDGIGAGTDGNVWFGDEGATPAIGRITPTGVITEFGTANGLEPSSSPNEGFAAGPDGNVWFTDGGAPQAIGRIAPSGTISEFSSGFTAGSNPYGIAAGPDGDLWFTEHHAIGRIDPTTLHVDEFSAGLNAVNNLNWITQGPDGNMWFADLDGSIGRITTPPKVVTTSASATGTTTATMSGKVNGHAQATTFHIEYRAPGGPTRTTAEQSLGTTTGDTPVSMTLSGLAPATTYQARVVVTNPTGTTDGAFVSFTTTGGLLTKVSQSHRRWREGNGLPHIASVRPPVGTTFRFTLNESAKVRFVFKQRLPGRRVGGRCVAPTAKNRSKPKCTRLVGRGSLSFSVKAGAHRLRFQGRLSKRKRLPIGHYTLVITATNSAGQHASAKLTFTIVKV